MIWRRMDLRWSARVLDDGRGEDGEEERRNCCSVRWGRSESRAA